MSALSGRRGILLIAASDYDLCTSCISSPSTRRKHNAGHSFWPIDQPGDKTAYNDARTAVQASRTWSPEKASHPYITCDVCRASGFSGVRFKCLECEGMSCWLLVLASTNACCLDYDMCEKCMSSSEAVFAHAPHAFFPIEDPTRFAAYGRARQQRKDLNQKTTGAVPSPIFGAPRKVHTGINCDACGNKPLAGVRFKCLHCPGMDALRILRKIYH